jgi:hypothetical protein
VLLCAPTAVLFLYHWYTGLVPALPAVAVKVTLVAMQMGLAMSAAMLMVVTAVVLTLSTVTLLFAVAFIRHAALLVNTHHTLSLFFSALSA